MAERRPAGFNVALRFYDSDEVLSIPRKIRAEAVGAWTLCGSYSANQLTDGFVSDEKLKQLGCRPQIRAALCATTPEPLWIPAPNGDGIQFTRWRKWQRMAAEVKDWREAEADRKRREREAKTEKKLRESSADSSHIPSENSAESDTNPSENSANEHRLSSCDSQMSGRTTNGQPTDVRTDDRDPKTEPETEPVTTGVVTSDGARKRAARIEPAWMPDPDVIAAMRVECPNVNLEAEHRKFIDYWTAKAGKDGAKLDWAATWRNWIRRAAETAQTRAPAPHKMRSLAELAARERQREQQTEIPIIEPKGIAR